MTKPLTADRLRELFRYEPETGRFVRLVEVASNALAGSVAGSDNGQGYRLIKIDGFRYRAHRLAWLYMAGQWPVGEIDHRNGSRDDNRWTNLRQVSHALNLQNQRRPKGETLSGQLGVRPGRNGRWRASITTAGVWTHIGQYATKEEATQAYLAAKRRAHSTCQI